MVFNGFRHRAAMGLFGRGKSGGGKKDGGDTKCKECGLELPTPERLERHVKKAHGNIPEKKFDPNRAGDGTW